MLSIQAEQRHRSKMQRGGCSSDEPDTRPPLGWAQTDTRRGHVRLMGVDARIIHTLHHRQ